MAIDTALLRRSIDLPALIGRKVVLKRHRDHSVGLCPFHAEKTPSFYVYADGSYHCFGCGAHGDCLDWVMAIDGVDFLEAAGRLGADEIDGRELRRRERQRQADSAAETRRFEGEHPWTVLELRWIAEQANRWRAEVEWIFAWRDTADYHYLRAEWERGL